MAGGYFLFWYVDSAGADKDILGVYFKALISAGVGYESKETDEQNDKCDINN
jgi:hypothetical protein